MRMVSDWQTWKSEKRWTLLWLRVMIPLPALSLGPSTCLHCTLNTRRSAGKRLTTSLTKRMSLKRTWVAYHAEICWLGITLPRDDLKSLQHLRYCIKEAIRLFPSVPFTGRVFAQDKEVCGYMMPKGTSVLCSIYAVHHHPDYWENPEVRS